MDLAVSFSSLFRVDLAVSFSSLFRMDLAVSFSSLFRVDLAVSFSRAISTSHVPLSTSTCSSSLLAFPSISFSPTLSEVSVINPFDTASWNDNG